MLRRTGQREHLWAWTLVIIGVGLVLAGLLGLLFDLPWLPEYGWVTDLLIKVTP